MLPRTLTVLAAIRPGEEASLRGILRPIGDDIAGERLDRRAGGVRIEFTRSRRIHFARFAILADPDRGPDRMRLLYSAAYDGDLDGHLAELISITSDMDAIWGRCEDYAGAQNFARFIRTHAFEPEAFYIAFRDGTVAGIKDAIAARRQAQTLAESVSASRSAVTPAGPSTADSRRDGANAGRAVSNGIERLARALPIAIDVVSVVARLGFTNVLRATQRMTASLDRYTLVRWANKLTDNRMPARRSLYSSVRLDNCAALAPLEPGDEVPAGQDRAVPPTFREDVVTQNQLTLVTVVKPGQADRVRAVMAAIDSYAKRLAPPGSLLGISTIHFVKWLVIDEGRRLMMVSDYDGSWESYIDEFAEMILSGLDAIWETAYGYPPDGARDVPAFKWFLRSHQVPAEVFFSAYPDETVVNLVSDLARARACSGATRGPVHAALQRP